MNILMVGLGGAGQRHLRNLRDVLGDRGTFWAWRARGREGAITPDFSKVESTSLGVRPFPTLEAALGERPDAVVISNPTSLHLPVARAAAEAGAHLLVEKPLSHTLDGIDDLDRVLTSRGRIGLVGYMMRFHPCARQIRQWIREGKFGTLLSARFEVASYVPDWHPYEDYRELYAVRRELGGGVILTESHDLDLVTWFFGLPRKVYAAGGAVSGLSGDVEDTAVVTLDYGFPVVMQMCFMQRPPSRCVEVTGTKARAVWDGGPSVRLFEKGWIEIGRASYDRAQMFRDEAAHFVSCIETGAPPLIPIAEGASSLRLGLAALRSLETGQPVEAL